ncbi:MAG: HEPN domain-containing protein [Candidatus Kaelpia aquatica]|nr:HEPN domain-containing protein [Candidatus Kaelpia aquatica]
MSYNNSKEHLLKEGVIKKCAVDHKAIRNLLKRAYVDLKTAERNYGLDEECAYTYAYNALLRTGLALILSHGFRPDVKNKHLTVIKFATDVLGNEFKQLIRAYDIMRKKRHKFIYEPAIPCSAQEAKNAMKIAQEFVDKVFQKISAEDPQHKLKF